MDSYLGQIILFAGQTVPQGWAACDGSTLPISGNEALFAVLGTVFGGNGSTNFGLPDLRSRIPVGAGKNAAGINYPLGQKAGSETVSIVEANMPVHSHTVQASTGDSNTSLPANAVLAKAPTNHVYYFNPPNPVPSGMSIVTKQMSAAAVYSAGESHTYDVHMPSLGISYLICTQGIYPVKP